MDAQEEELIRKNGALIAPGDAEGFRSAMQDMLRATDAEWKKLSDASLRLYSEQYTAQRFTEKLSEVYRNLGFSL